METLKRGGKIFLDKDETKESAVNHYLSCRDGIVEVVEYISEGGDGNEARIFLCENTKHESLAVIKQDFSPMDMVWKEVAMYFDSESFKFFKTLITRDFTETTKSSCIEIRNYNKL